MNDDDGKGQPIPADVAAAQREAEELEHGRGGIRTMETNASRTAEIVFRRLTLSRWPRYGFVSKS